MAYHYSLHESNTWYSNIVKWIYLNEIVYTENPHHFKIEINYKTEQWQRGKKNTFRLYSWLNFTWIYLCKCANSYIHTCIRANTHSPPPNHPPTIIFNEMRHSKNQIVPTKCSCVEFKLTISMIRVVVVIVAIIIVIVIIRNCIWLFLLLLSVAVKNKTLHNIWHHRIK